MSAERRSVFGGVDQGAIIKRLAEAPSDDPEAMVSYEPTTHTNPAILAGIHAFADAREQRGEADTPEAGDAPGPIGPSARLARGPVTPVDYRGSLVNDVTARRSFILYGPAGVRRSFER
jgi:hypothetical protein